MTHVPGVSKSAKTSGTDGETTTLTLPLLRGTVGPDAVDVRGLYKERGLLSYDPGFMSTAPCQSGITYIDGEKGELLYRGYPIGQLAEKCTYLEVCYLLLFGDMPNRAQLEEFENTVMDHTMVHEGVATFYHGFRPDAHPMSILCGVSGALASFYQDSIDVHNPRQREISAYRLIAKMPTLVAMSYKYSKGQPFMYPDNNLSYAGNFLRMMFAVPTKDYFVNPVVEQALDRFFILYADHEQNASASAVRLAGSCGANPFACVAAGVATLWGPLHGGANEAVVSMLQEIRDARNIPAFVAKVKDKMNQTRLMGFGHRVYKNFDPRAHLMRDMCHAVLKELGTQDKLLDVALELEKVALEDPYFIERKLYPNVDFYSGLMLRAIGIPSSMFTCMFAMSRTVGWIAHWMELLGEPGRRISRPRQLYTGPTHRDVVPLGRR